MRKRRAVVVAGEDEDAARGHHDQVAVGVGRLGAVLAERGNRNVDQRGINRGQVGIAETVFREIAGVIGLDENVGIGDESAQEIAARVAR